MFGFLDLKVKISCIIRGPALRYTQGPKLGIPGMSSESFESHHRVSWTSRALFGASRVTSYSLSKNTQENTSTRRPRSRIYFLFNYSNATHICNVSATSWAGKPDNDPMVTKAAFSPDTIIGTGHYQGRKLSAGDNFFVQRILPYNCATLDSLFLFLKKILNRSVSYLPTDSAESPSSNWRVLLIGGWVLRYCRQCRRLGHQRCGPPSSPKRLWITLSGIFSRHLD